MNLVKKLIRNSLKQTINELGLEGTRQAINSLVDCKLKEEYIKEFEKRVYKK
jgi:hypothetical protein